jgi:hypothetical protein
MEVRAELHEGDKEALIYALRNNKATDNDCKIDAVLIARKLIDADPAAVKRVKVTFFDQNNRSNYRQVVVREGDVKAYAARVIDQNTLLEELELVMGQGNPSEAPPKKVLQGSAHAPEVAPGILQDERATLLSQINALKAKGVGVSPFLGQFAVLEEKAKQGDQDGAAKLLQSLGEAVTQQSEQLKKIQEQKRLVEAERQNQQIARMRQEEEKATDLEREKGDKRSHMAHEQWEQEEVEERMARTRAELGDLAPAIGPSFRRRRRIARVLKEMQDKGQDISSYLQIWNDAQRLAANGKEPEMKSRLQWLESNLNIQPWQSDGNRH